MARSDFDDFLFATIGDDKHGMQLSVNSALARSDVDPWEEAATLARLPVEAATRKLAALIAALPGGPLAPPDAESIAARLVALLPSEAVADSPSRTTSVPGVASRLWAVKYIIFFVVYAIYMLSSRWLGGD